MISPEVNFVFALVFHYFKNPLRKYVRRLILTGFFFLVSVGAGIERLMIHNSEVVGEDESMEIFDLVGNQHGNHLPSETVKQMYNASAEEIR